MAFKEPLSKGQSSILFKTTCATTATYQLADTQKALWFIFQLPQGPTITSSPIVVLTSQQSELPSLLVDASSIRIQHFRHCYFSLEVRFWKVQLLFSNYRLCSEPTKSCRNHVQSTVHESFLRVRDPAGRLPIVSTIDRGVVIAQCLTSPYFYWEDYLALDDISVRLTINGSRSRGWPLTPINNLEQIFIHNQGSVKTGPCDPSLAHVGSGEEGAEGWGSERRRYRKRGIGWSNIGDSDRRTNSLPQARKERQCHVSSHNQDHPIKLIKYSSLAYPKDITRSRRHSALAFRGQCLLLSNRPPWPVNALCESLSKTARLI